MSDSALFDVQAAVRDASKMILGADAPDRSYVALGSNPAFDDTDQMTVHAAGFDGSGSNVQGAWAGGKLQAIAGPAQVTIVVTIIRCADASQLVGGVPTADSIETTALQVCSDAWRLFNGFRRLTERKELLVGLVDPFVTAPIPVDEQGGAAGWQLGIVGSIDGYDPFA